MAWWLARDYGYAGPGFDWLYEDNVEEKRGLVGSGLSLSRPLSEKNVPKAARYREKYPKPPAPDIFFVDSATTVTARFKALVEEFEPGLHLFAPIELQFHDGTAMPGEYYFFNCNVDVDCVLTDNKPEWFRETRYGKIHPSLGLIQKLTPLEISLSKPQIEGRHLWTGGPLGWNQLFVSDAFCKALRKGRFGAVDIRRECHEVDRLWVAEEHMGPLIEAWKTYVAHNRNCEAGYI
ncbi:imm11 family protein [Sphingobium subterraneum]|uniref:Immunity MXAN-0049 protein domain-containing protein n=1 Tax=Sphingobium subterraneum TaxID=627688 RepID=A0A841J4K3_9SPHN|nr:DUF1629 domain-containing protein [Sphingobium subterraneum]MBB6124446.1 hypothetical protein [Sphingobium subterraneum]